MNPGVIVFNDDYGTSLRDVVETIVTDAGAHAHLRRRAGQEFDPNETNFNTIVSGALATNPDAIAIIAFTTQTPLIVSELAAQGYDMSKVYFVDGNLHAVRRGVPARHCSRARRARCPGAFPSDEFQARLLEVNDGLTDFSYAPESYDATILAALAAVKGGAHGRRDHPGQPGCGLRCRRWREVLDVRGLRRAARRRRGHRLRGASRVSVRSTRTTTRRPRTSASTRSVPTTSTRSPSRSSARSADPA